MGRLLEARGYGLHSNPKTKEGASHPDRDAQFEHIDETVKEFQRREQPVISVDTKKKEKKKKELVGEYSNGGRQWRAKGDPEEVLVDDFMDKRSWARPSPMVRTIRGRTRGG